MAEIGGMYSTEKAARREKKLQAVVWQLLCLFPVLWCHSVCECVWVCARVSKQCCAYLCVGMYYACPCPYELHTSAWWERVILQSRAVNNRAIISFPPMTWMYTEHTVTRTWLMGNHTNFHSDFFIFTTDTQVVICYVPLYSHKCGTEREMCNPISFVYYCYYWWISKCITSVLSISTLFHFHMYFEARVHPERTEWNTFDDKMFRLWR